MLSSSICTYPKWLEIPVLCADEQANTVEWGLHENVSKEDTIECPLVKGWD